MPLDISPHFFLGFIDSEMALTEDIGVQIDESSQGYLGLIRIRSFQVVWTVNILAKQYSRPRVEIDRYGPRRMTRDMNGLEIVMATAQRLFGPLRMTSTLQGW
jgi:hypothetical protein